MNTLLLTLPETVALVAVVCAIQLTALAFRNPFRLAWMRRTRSEGVASIMMIALFTFAVAFEISGLAEAGLPVAVAIGVTVAIVLAVGIANWRIFEYGERLRKADAGQSPFHPVRHVQGPLGTHFGG